MAMQFDKAAVISALWPIRSLNERLLPLLALGLCGLLVTPGFGQESSTPQAPEAKSGESTPHPATSQPAMPSIIQKLPNYLGDFWKRKYMTGDWGGARTELAEHGILVDLDLTQNFQGNAHGGHSTNGAYEYGGSADLRLQLDTARMGLWPGGLIVLHGETQMGHAVNKDVGAFMLPNIKSVFPVPDDPGETTLSEFYLMQALSEKVVVAAGKMDLLALGDRNAFAGDATHTTQFMNTGFNVNPVLLTAAPYTCMAAGVILIPTDWLQISTLVCDNDPNGAANMTGFNTAFHGRDWMSVMQEYDLKIKPFNRPGNQRIGWFWTSKDFTEFESDPRDPIPARHIEIRGVPGFAQKLLPKNRRKAHIGDTLLDLRDPDTRPDNCGMYYNFDQYLFCDAKDPTKGWGLFGRFGLAPSQANLFHTFYSIGLGGKGAIPLRDQDTWGVGYYYGNVDNNLGSRMGIDNEQGVEMFYNIEVTPWFHITPDLQVIANPAGDFGNRTTAIVYGLRGQINF